MADTVGILIRDVPPELKARLAADAEARETNLNEVAVEILAKAYGVSYEPTGGRSSGVKDSPDTLLRVPPTLRQKLRVRSATTGRPMRTLVLEALAPHYDLPTPEPPKRGPKPHRVTAPAR